MDFRLVELERWLGAQFPAHRCTLAPASADASFRRYWRARLADGRSFIVMDAPPDKEDCRPFLQVAGLFAAAGAHVPAIHAQDLEAGFLLLEDLGEATFLDCLSRGDDPQPLYAAATDTLIRIQQASRPGVLPDYDRALLERELNLFPGLVSGARAAARARAARPGDAARGLRRAARQQPRAAARVRAPRLPFAQPDASAIRCRACWISRTRSTARSPTTWFRCCATPT